MNLTNNFFKTTYFQKFDILHLLNYILIVRIYL